MKEWVAGRLADEMGLPVAEIRQVKIARGLIAGNQEYEQELGHGLAFGSRKVINSERLALEFIREDGDGGLSQILLFDWWIRNSDRALTEIGGNPNLLWEFNPGRVVMIDHDNAFDADFDPQAFWNYHALRTHQGAWSGPKRREMEAWLASGVSLLPSIWAELPNEWLEDDYGDPRCRLDKDGLSAVLLCPDRNPDFWNPAVPES